MSETARRQPGYSAWIWLLLIFSLIAPNCPAAGGSGNSPVSLSTPAVDYHLVDPAQDKQPWNFLSCISLHPARFILESTFTVAALSPPQDASLLPPALILLETFLPRPPPRA